MAANQRAHETKPATPVMTLREVADYLRVAPTTIYRMLKVGRIPAFKMGSDWRFDKNAIDQWRADGGTCKAAE